MSFYQIFLFQFTSPTFSLLSPHHFCKFFSLLLLPLPHDSPPSFFSSPSSLIRPLSSVSEPLSRHPKPRRRWSCLETSRSTSNGLHLSTSRARLSRTSRAIAALGRAPYSGHPSSRLLWPHATSINMSNSSARARPNSVMHGCALLDLLLPSSTSELLKTDLA